MSSHECLESAEVPHPRPAILSQQILNPERAVRGHGCVRDREALGWGQEREKVPLVTVADRRVLGGPIGSDRGAPHGIGHHVHSPLPGVMFVNRAFLSPERSAEDAVNGERARELDAGRRRRDRVPACVPYSSLGRPLWLLAGFFADALSPPTKHSVREGVLAVRVQHPVVVLSPRPGGIPQHLQKAVVQGQVVPH